jgi:NAD(P)-dependent dehydrogenase (short-subunit alcohol dehydrogenase family)
MQLFDLSGKTAVVTGGTKGMGRAISERLAEHGAKVVVASRTLADCQAVVAELESKYGAGCAIPCAFDLTDRASVDAPVKLALETWGRIDIVVGNAAAIVMGNHANAKDEDYDLSFSANVRNNSALAKAALPAMKKQGGGSIIFVASTVGLFPSPPYLVYSLAKAALAHLTRILAVDLGPDNIRVNCIAPGLIKTAGTEALQSDPAAVKRAIGRNPLGRMGESDEIAGAAVFLASPASGYVTGQVIPVDGGQIHQGRENARQLAEGPYVA